MRKIPDFVVLLKEILRAMHPGNRNKVRRLLRLQLLYLGLRRLRTKRILDLCGDTLRFRRCSQRTFNSKRGSHGEFNASFNELRTTENDDMHFEYFRMTKESFDEILAAIRPLIQHAGTHRSPVSTEERLAITIRCCFIATTNS